jgi:acetylornithine deacetylase/succinyl-diaminopimelate desuccinylase-like protein
MATYISVLEDCIRQGLRITKNIIILGCSDEEYSFSGISALDKVGLKADYALVGEPTDLKANRSHKGLLRCIISSQGIAGHSSAPERGENAIYRMAEAVLKLRDYHSGLSSVQHPLLGSASLSVGTIQGGTTVNTIPSSATIQVDRRLIPGEDPETVFNDLQKLLKPISGITLSAPYVTCAGFEEPEASTICKLLHQGCQHQQHSLEFIHTPFATHAPFFQALGIPTLIFGPGSITQAHTKDEFVPISEVEKFYAIIRHLVTS